MFYAVSTCDGDVELAPFSVKRLNLYMQPRNCLSGFTIDQRGDPELFSAVLPSTRTWDQIYCIASNSRPYFVVGPA